MRRLFLFAVILSLHTLTLLADECDAAGDCETTAYGIAEDLILAYPEPEVTQLDYEQDRALDRWYQEVNGTITVHNAPGGEVVRVLDDGFNFVTSLREENGWTEINRGEWVQSDKLVSRGWSVSQFTGIYLPEEGLPYPMAWLLVNLNPSKVPGGLPAESNGMWYRYTRVNLFDEVEVDGFVWYQIGVDKWVHQHHVSKVILLERPADVDTLLWISIDLYEQVVIAYEGETPVFATLIATGLDRWPTREGVYHIYYRKPRKHMSGGVVGDDYYFLEEVPWTMFFDEGRALHGAYWHDAFGYRRSHGCVNLSISDARWLYEWVAEEMGSNASADIEEGPAVYVYSSGVYE